MRLIAEELNMNRGKSVTDYYGGFGNEKNFHRDGASNLDRRLDTSASWLRNPLQK
jgi:hypothetical protein